MTPPMKKSKEEEESKVERLPIGEPIDFNTKTHLTDATFVIEGKRIHAGKQVFSLSSPYFNAILYGNFKEKEQEEIELKDVNYELYYSELEIIQQLGSISDDHVETLLELGDRFGITMLVNQVESHLLLRTSRFTLAEKWLLSDKYRLARLE
ncbi:hypothetical protein PFISCL1PPCAC_21177, partial [Pristionchus fissidentatus]